MANFTIKSSSSIKYPFLSGGGEMGELMRSKDWSNSSIGTPDQWPQSLRTTLSIILNARFPMFLWWGPELICFYNDAYRPSLGMNGKHPGILGMPAEEAWGEIWHIIKPLIDRVLINGESTWDEDRLISIYRNGKMEEVYWTFSYSPVSDESGNAAGVFVNCIETTDKIINAQEIVHGEKKFKSLIKEAPIPITVFCGPEFVIDLANKETLKLWGKDESIHRKKLIVAMPELEHRIEILKNVYATGETYYGNESLDNIEIDGVITTTYINVIYKALRKNDGEIDGILTMGYNVTEQVEARKKIEYNEERLRLAADTAKLGTFDMKLPERKLICSDRVYNIFGFNDTDISYETLISLIHPDDLHIWEEANKLVAVTGHINYEARILWQDKTVHWINIYGKVFYDKNKRPARVLGTIMDITEQRQAEDIIRESEQRFKAIADTAPVMIWMSGTDKSCNFFNKGWLDFTNRTLEQELGNGWAESVHPDDCQRRFDIYVSSFDARKEFYMEYRLKRYDGQYKWISDKGIPRYADDGVFLGYIGGCMDIDEQRTFAEKLKASEERFRLLANVMPQFIWTSDPFGNLYYFNQSVYQYTGLTEEDVQNGGWAKIVNPEDREESLKKWNYSIETGTDFIFEHRFRKDNGEYRWLLSRAVPYRDSSGKIQMWIGTSTDIHDQKIFSDKLQKSELLFKTISNASPVGLWMTDVNGDNVFVNDTWIKWTGMPLEKHYGHGWLSRVVAEDKLAMPSFKEAFLQREKYTAEFRIVRQDGELCWCLTEGEPYYDIHGEFAGYAGSVTDITDIKKLEEQKDFFISMASHELKTPITSIKGYVQILLSMHGDSQDTFLKNSLLTVNKQVGSLTILIADLLDMSKIKSGSLQLDKEYFCINKMISETVDEVKHTQPDYTITFSSEEKSIVCADRGRIAQVLINFLTNAIKYSPNVKTVTVKSSISDNYAVVSVIDAGIGINKVDQEKIFQRFYRVEGKDEKTFPGFGIGLFIAAEIIQRHDGKIGVESELGKGSIFTFSLPLENLN